MFDKFLDKLAEKVNEGLISSINLMFGWIADLLGYALNVNDGAGGVNELSAGDLIRANPVTWLGGGSGSGGGAMWEAMRDISDNAIIPIALMILLVVMVTELVQIMVSGNQFENVGIGAFIKWSIKTFVGILLVSNVFNIASLVFKLGVRAGTKGIEVLLPKIDELDTTVVIGGISGQQTLELLIMLVLSFLTFLCVALLLLVIIAVLAGRMIDVFMYLTVAPIPMATFMNSEWRQMGNNWLRGIIALAFQAVFVVIAIMIFVVLFGRVQTAIINTPANQGNISTIFNMFVLMAYTIALIFTVLRSGSISKSVFGAH